MKRLPSRHPWQLLALGLLLAILALLALGPARTVADDYDDLLLIRIEEDWELVIREPAPDLASPQVSTQMARSPFASRFCNLHLNSCDIPSFSQGGMQLQVWQGTTNLAVQTSENREVLRTPDERITWTQYLSRDSSSVRFGISAASSQTWGDFSGVEVTVSTTSFGLGDYSADYSRNNSGVTFGANRVESLILLAVRKYYATGVVIVDDTDRVVFLAEE